MVFKHLAAITVSILLLAGCAGYSPMRDENRQNIAKIDKGMTKAQVYQIMGEKSYSGTSGTFSNPYKREIIKDRAGNEYEILYYYTEQIGEKHWEEGQTPVILVDGKVVGVGWRYIESSDLNVTVRRRN